MKQICFYFQVHQPRRLRRIRLVDEEGERDYWDRRLDNEILNRVGERCYQTTNRLLERVIHDTDGRFRFAFSTSGVLLEHLEEERPDVLQSFQDLAHTGSVEFLAETYYHSLAGLWPDETEFRDQVEQHRSMIRRLFGQEPTTFRNTELLYSDHIAQRVAALGFDTVLTEGVPRVLGWRSPNYVYQSAVGDAPLRVLMRNDRLSDDIAFRFGHPIPGHGPLMADTYVRWLEETPGDMIGLFMDYETFGEHHWKDSGILQFLEATAHQIDRSPHLEAATPAEVTRRHAPADTVHCPDVISWADEARDASAWLGNDMQWSAFRELEELAPLVRAVNDPATTDTWRRLQISDHLYYCADKNFADQEVHSYFSPYDSPYMAFINHRNALHDLRERLEARLRANASTRTDDGHHDGHMLSVAR